MSFFCRNASHLNLESVDMSTKKQKEITLSTLYVFRDFFFFFFVVEKQ